MERVVFFHWPEVRSAAGGLQVRQASQKNPDEHTCTKHALAAGFHRAWMDGTDVKTKPNRLPEALR
jgi:hypothetical protein